MKTSISQWLLIILVAMDSAIAVVVGLYVRSKKQTRKPSSPPPTPKDKGKHEGPRTKKKATPPPEPRHNIYYNLEEDQVGQHPDMQIVVEALKHVPKPRDMATYPTPATKPTARYEILKTLVSKERNPNLMTATDIQKSTPLPHDQRVRFVSKEGPKKQGKRDGFVV